ncbi:MAG: hypothetical protein KAY50_04650 [Chitinophagaceae bacterium]|nr:hypothetical protein [Chitinophagaceae bacterium]
MAEILTYRILIVDDNPFPTRECCGILLDKLKNYFGKPFDHTLQEYYCNDYVDLKNEYSNIKGKSFHFVMNGEVSLSIYNYNPTDTKENNQSKIHEIIKDKEINIFWTDRGHTNFRINGEEMFEETNGHPAKADEIYQNTANGIVQQLKTNGIRQVAMYSYNPKFTYTDIDNKVEEIGNLFQGKLSKDDVYVLETSPILNLFSLEDKLYPGLPETEKLGTLNAYKYYGKLLGSVLFDLFLQIRENKAKLSDKQKRYNFFNRYNRNFLRYFKLLNSDLINKFKDFKIAMVSFYGNIYGQEHFLIDVPYKEYYEKYDNELRKVIKFHEGNAAIGSIIDPIKTDNALESKKWLHFKYKKNDDGEFIGCYELEDSIKFRGPLVERYLPLLHTGIFYEPDFYSNEDFPFTNFKITTKDEFCLNAGNGCVEIIYLFKKVSFEGVEGVSHFVVWRRVQPESESFKLTEAVEEIWENFYRLVEPKLEAALVNILQSETAKQAIKSAISQVMARNSSHNIGSHVMNKLINGKTLKQLNLVELYSKKNKDQKFNYHSLIEIESLGEEAETYHQLAIFNNYVKCRMDYLSDITFGTPLMQTTKKVYDLFEELDKVRLLLENISGLTEFHYKIKFTFNGGDIDKNLSLALPNDILGCQALYNIIENVIRNTAKHSKNKEKAVDDNGNKMIIFTINIKEIEKDVPAEVQCAECYEVEIFDNVPVESGDKEFKTDDEIIELKNYVEDYNKYNDIKISEATPVSNIAYLVYSQNKKLNDSILQDNNSLRASGLGLIEMEASASYLRKLDISNIESDAYNIAYNKAIYNKVSNNLNIVKAFKAGKDENYLGYRFFMLRPAEVLVVTNNELENVSTNDWLKLGVKITGINDFKTSLEGGKVVYNHQFLVFDDDSVKEIIELTEKKVIEGKEYELSVYKTSLPLRVLKIENVNTLFGSDFTSMELMLWAKWQSVFNTTGTTLFIDNIKNPPIANHTAFVFFNHVGEDETPKNKKIVQDILNDDNETGYFEALSSKAQTALPNFNVYSKVNTEISLKPIQKYLNYVAAENTEQKKMLESCVAKIIVIDERVQAACNGDYMGVLFRNLYNKSMIFVPEYKEEQKKGINLAALSYDDKLVAKIKNYVCNQEMKQSDFVIFHYSILERMFANHLHDKLVSEINNYLDILSTKVSVVITSGRGTPKGLTKTVRFVNLSPILSALVEVRSKYLINGILYSSRKSSDI